MATIEGYASAASAAPGDTVDFHVRSDTAPGNFTMEIDRRGVDDVPLKSAEGDAFVPGPQDDANLAINGCDWPAVENCRTVIPADWKSGYYVAKLSANGASTEIPFVVRSATPGTTSKILVKLSDTTTQAYTNWGGRGLYETPFSPSISFDRPYNDVQGLYEIYQLQFIRWLERNGIAVDFCSSLDLHSDPQLLAPYRLLASIGHDEYWSLEMRDQAEAFIAGGGNVCFFSGNTCFWQIRLDLGDSGRIMFCSKESEAGHAPDPERGDPRRVTTEWSKPPVNRPENSLTGVAFRNGAGWWDPAPINQNRFRGYTVTNASHWVLDGTGLSDGETFGAGTSVDDTILGYETDAALTNGAQPPQVLGTDGTPKSFVVLAAADLSDWASQAGHATMGIYQRNGIVFTAGTVNWAGGLNSNGAATPVDRITRNLLDALSRDRSPQLAVADAGFEDWSNGLPTGWTLDGAGTVSAQAADPDASENQMRFTGGGGSFNASVDASSGETWIGAPGLTCAANTTYGVGCWAKSSEPGATIRLQTTDTWTDFATAAHSGSGAWEYLFAVGQGPGAAAYPARVKIQVAPGVQALFDNVSVMEVPDVPG
jgi:hypothetical protein